MNNTEDDAKIDEILQHVEFWRERGAAVAQECSDRHEPWGPAVDQAFAEWRENPGPKYTVPKLRRWIQHASALRRSTNSPHVLSRYWGIQNMFLDLEDRALDAVVNVLHRKWMRTNSPENKTTRLSPSRLRSFGPNLTPWRTPQRCC